MGQVERAAQRVGERVAGTQARLFKGHTRHGGGQVNFSPHLRIAPE